MKKVLFEESQKNVQLLAIIPAVMATILFGILSGFQLILHKPMGNNPAPNWLLLLFFFGSIIGLFIFSLQKLKTEITEDEIVVSFGLFAKKNVISVKEIKSVSIRKYDAIKEFWGWGVRSNSSERCFTVTGSDGIEIELTNGRHILIGTQKPLELNPVILSYLPNQAN